MNQYISSLINKYGDTDNVKRDTKQLLEILDRQGTDLLIDTIAEFCGTEVNDLKLSTEDREKLIQDLLFSFDNALRERI